MATITLVGERLEAVPQQTDADALELLDRIQRVVGQAASLIADADAQMLTPKLLDVTQACIAPVPIALASFSEDGDRAHLTQANEALDDLIDDVGWPLAYAAREPAGLREAAANYRRSAGQLVRALGEEVGAVRTELAAVTDASDAAKADIQTTATDATTTITTTVADAQASLSALNTEVEAQKTRLATLMSDYNTQFLAGETARTTKSDSALTTAVGAAEAAVAEQVEKHEATRSAAETSYKASLSGLKEDGARGLSEIEGLKEQALKLVNTIGAIGFSGSYGSYAEQEKGPAKIWRRVAAATVFALILVQVGLVLALGPTPVTWENIAQRSLVSAPFLVLAGYAAAQSGKHQENSRAARQRELELAAMDPYLVLLPEDAQKTIKTEAALRMFAHPQTGAAGKDDTVGTPQLLHLIEEFIKHLGK